jgi:uncharacterized protein
LNASLILSNVLNPPVLFFFIGMTAVFLKSDLDIPQPLPKLFSLYLLFAIGFKGGHEIHETGINATSGLILATAILMAMIVPIYSFFILKIKLDTYNAAAIAAAYGSISAVTFITATSFLDQQDLTYGGHMVAALALMESPAIIVGILLVRIFVSRDQGDEANNQFSWSEVLREAFLNGYVFLLLGSLFVGLVTSQQGWDSLKTFTGDMFYGMLTFFLLDMGLVAARRIQDLQKSGSFLISFSVFMPVVNALIGITLAYLLQMSKADALLFSVLCASASYIAVPATMRMSVPEANPSLYISMALALTFPFNIIIGIPLYFGIISKIWGA